MYYENITIRKASHPEKWAMITKAFPGYRKRTAVWVQSDNVTLTGRYWDGGSKSDWRLLDEAREVVSVSGRHDFPFTAPDIEIDLMDGTIAIDCGTYCGKQASAYLYTKPEDEDATPETTQETR